MTEWQPISGYEGLYQVSSSGEVRKTSGRMLKQWENDQGYRIVRLNNPRKCYRVHRLVAAAFCFRPSGANVVNHINHVRSDNRCQNLEWCTQWQNLNHAQKHNRMQRDYWEGKRSPNAILSDDQVREIRSLYKLGGTSYEKLGRKYSLSKRAVQRVIKQETYKDVR